jgi:transposase InsO family protein
LNREYGPITAGKPGTQRLEWNTEADNAFSSLKQLLTSAPVLIFPNFANDFILEVDASLSGLGACLGQISSDEMLHPISFASRGLRGAERQYPDYSSFKLELLALKWAVADKYCDYLLGAHTIVYTDNNPLAHLETAKLGATEQRWIAKLAPFDMEIRYRTGRSNKCADALSRCPANMCAESVTGSIHIAMNCSAIPNCLVEVTNIQLTTVIPEPEQGPTPALFPSYSLEELSQMQLEDPELKQVWALWNKNWKLGQDDSGFETTKCKGWIREWSKLKEHKKVLYRVVEDHALGPIRQFLVPEQLRLPLLQLAHDQWGHQGIGRTLALLKTRCFWPGMVLQIKLYIKQCFPCTVAKAPVPKVKAPMQHLLAFRPLELLAIDFLKLDKGHGGSEDVLVMTDAYTKFSMAIPCSDQTAVTVGRVLRDHWFSCYGIPLRLHSDRGRNFEGGVIAELCKLYGVIKGRTTPYHPQGNGQTERFNQTLCRLIKSIPSQKRRRWPELLKHLCFVYNSTPHRVTGVPPYSLMFGRVPVLPLDQLLNRTNEHWEDNFVKTQAKFLQRVHDVVRQRMEATVEKDKQRYDKRAKADVLPVGSRVLLQQCAFDSRHKLADNYFHEPFVIVSHKEESNVYSIRPVSGGPVRTINRKLLILDPRQSEPNLKLPDFGQEMDETSSDSDDQVSLCSNESINNVKSDSEPEEITYRFAFRHEAIDEPEEPVSDVPLVRRSNRANRGIHRNINHLPKSAHE